MNKIFFYDNIEIVLKINTTNMSAEMNNTAETYEKLSLEEKINAKLDSLENKSMQWNTKVDELKTLALVNSMFIDSKTFQNWWIEANIVVKRNKNFNEYYLLINWNLFNKPLNLNQIEETASKIKFLVDQKESINLNWMALERHFELNDSSLSKLSPLFSNTTIWEVQKVPGSLISDDTKKTLENATNYNNMSEEVFEIAMKIRNNVDNKWNYQDTISDSIFPTDKNWNQVTHTLDNVWFPEPNDVYKIKHTALEQQ